MRMLPDFLAIGHVSKDRLPSGFKLGGTVTYGSLTALKLGLRTAIVTSSAPDLDVQRHLAGVAVHTVPSAETTTFHNIYRHDRRTQLLEAAASPLTPSDVPRNWLTPRMVLLGPVSGEVSSQFARYFPRSLVVASMQGWLRRSKADGRVRPMSWDGREVMPHVDAGVVSSEDVDDDCLVDLWATLTPVLIVTAGREGAMLHDRRGWHHVAPFPVDEVDPTGAGDVFAAAFLVRFEQTREPMESARFASCVASFCVQAEGVEGIPTLAQVEQRLDSGSTA